MTSFSFFSSSRISTQDCRYSLGKSTRYAVILSATKNHLQKLFRIIMQSLSIFAAQKALNQDQYEPAQQLREKISEVENEIARQREAKMGASSKEEAQDKGLALLRIK